MIKFKRDIKLKKSHIPYIIIGSLLALSIPIGIGIKNTLNPTPQDPHNTYNPVDPNWEIDAQGIVTYIVDGDTYDMNSVGRVRLADIDCPDQGEAGCQAARDYLGSLINGNLVYIDIDDIYGTDVYNRTVAVAYVRYNSTHLLNVNKDLLVQGFATIWNFDNEFDPYNWSWYVYYKE